MKSETLSLLKQHLDAGKFEFVPVESGIQFDYELSDDEVKDIVEKEYGANFVGPVEELFKVIVKKLISIGIEHAKKEND